MYELLISWRSTGNLIIELEEFRKKLGIENNEYKRMGQFKEKVLDFDNVQSASVDKADGTHEFACVQSQKTLMGRG